MKLWRIITRRWDGEQYVHIDDLTGYLQKQLNTELQPETRKFINHLVEQLTLARLSK